MAGKKRIVASSKIKKGNAAEESSRAASKTKNCNGSNGKTSKQQQQRAKAKTKEVMVKQQVPSEKPRPSAATAATKTKTATATKSTRGLPTANGTTTKNKRKTRRSIAAAAEPFDLTLLPTPKRRKTSSSETTEKKSSESATTATATVTPSPAQKIAACLASPPAPPVASSWLAYDELLNGAHGGNNASGGGSSSSSSSSTSKTTSTTTWTLALTLPDSIIDDWYDLTESVGIKKRTFSASVDGLLEESLFSKSSPRLSDLYRWRDYAMTLSSHPKKRLSAVKEEFGKDRELHAGVLKGLTEEVSERRFGGKRFYLRALNCMFYDAFARCGIPRPPLVHYDLVMDPNMTRKEVYHRQLRAWNGLKSRAFAMLATVAESPMPVKDIRRDLPPITPVRHRGKMRPMKEECMNEEQVMEYKWDWEKKLKRTMLAAAEEDDWQDPVCDCSECNTKIEDAEEKLGEWEGRYSFYDDDDDDEDDNQSPDKSETGRKGPCYSGKPASLDSSASSKSSSSLY